MPPWRPNADDTSTLRWRLDGAWVRDREMGRDRKRWVCDRNIRL